MTAVLTIIILASLFGMGLGFAASRFKIDTDPVADQVDKLLPQTQCAQCGFPGCRPYAEAIAAGRYPLARPLYVVTNGPPRGAAKELVDFILGARGQALLSRHGYVPIDRGAQGSGAP